MNLTEKELALISQVAAQQVLEHFEKEKGRQEKVKHDHRLHNIKLLLKNYRSLVLHCEKIQQDLIEIDSTSIQELDISTISLESIESIKKSKEKSLAMVWFIRSKMEAYKRSCSKEDLKYFRVLEMKYIAPKKYTVREIAEIEHIEERTVRRYLEKAIADLPVIFFGVDAIKFE